MPCVWLLFYWKISVLCDHLGHHSDSPTQEATCWFTETCGCSVAQSGLTLCNLMDCVAYQAPLSRGFYKQDCWNGLSLPSPGDLSDPGTEPTSLTSPALAGGFFTTSATREALAEVRDACLCWQHFYKHRKSCCCNSRTLLWTEDISLRTLSDYAWPFLLNSYLWGKQSFQMEKRTKQEKYKHWKWGQTHTQRKGLYWIASHSEIRKDIDHFEWHELRQFNVLPPPS